MSDFREELKSLYGKYKIIPLDCIITPFYVIDGTICELYVYELYIDIVQKKDFNKHLLEYTKKKSIEEIPRVIIDRHRNCYIDLFIKENLTVESLLRYIDYIFNSKEMKDDIAKIASKVSNDNIFFEVYYTNDDILC